MSKVINPYPGLRPFTEEESIFFKGRDKHIRQIITQLQDKKIVIVTGASGAGKSSLIFAGVVPNARAGFFKALFNSWAVVSFRPERTPLHNLARELAAQLELDYQQTLGELQYGFSALVNLYKNSRFFVDPTDERWKNADEQTRKALKSQGANLLIIADQFEEFFTNPENFAAGRPSIEAYTTVNLLLETASIALQENLPIYIIFTMRSDFISDCVAFKGLPEYIGFSQFFVPRLKRNELQQVIEEPALLAGGSVSKRLTEILINQLREGFDQLPILQHTLHQLWITAGYGKEQLDLLHLAKIAGLHQSYLDAQDKEIFSVWFNNLPENEKKYFENPSLPNVLNYHANTLYDNAYLHYLENTPWVEDKSVINREDAKEILRITFLGLTRIDEGRAVRNRMTLKEITNLINREEITYGIVNGVINIFREPGSTFIRPFIDPDDPESRYISADTVLDITHEALIRNWELLQKWEHEEEENVNDFLEFRVQLKRWIDSGKRREYLLPLGPLTYFEQWYERCKPNKYWIAKYDKTETDKEKKLQKAEELEQQIREYLQQSRAYIIEQEKRKRRIRTALGIIAFLIILILIGFTGWALREKQNAEQQRMLAEMKKNEALEANKKAEMERRRAEMEKRRAEEEARKALLAKRQSDSAKNVALQMARLAQQQRYIAQQEALRAMREKRKADSLRKIAEEQKLKAIRASQEAQRLTLLSLAQSLAFKATQRYDDPQVNLLLAYYAYLLNRENGGNKYEPAIYEGLRYAYFLAKDIRPVRLADKTIEDFSILDPFTLVYMTVDGHVYTYDLLENKREEIVFRKKYLPKHPLLKAKFLNDTFAVANDVAGEWYLYDLVKHTTVRFYRPVTGKLIVPKDDRFFTLTGRGELILWRINPEGMPEEELRFEVGSQVNLIIPVPGEEQVILITRYGAVSKLDLLTGEKTFLFGGREQNLSNIAMSAAITSNKQYLATGFADGEIYLYDLQKQTKFDQINVSNSLVKILKFDKQGQKLIVVSPDNTINILLIKALHDRPVSIDVKNEKIQQIRVLDSKIYTLYENKTFLSFYIEPDIYAEALRKYIKRNFTDEEWQQFFGNTLKKYDIIP